MMPMMNMRDRVIKGLGRFVDELNNPEEEMNESPEEEASEVQMDHPIGGEGISGLEALIRKGAGESSMGGSDKSMSLKMAAAAPDHSVEHEPYSEDDLRMMEEFDSSESPDNAEEDIKKRREAGY